MLVHMEHFSFEWLHSVPLYGLFPNVAAVTIDSVGTARTRAPLSGVPVPAPALPINGQATLGFFLPTDTTAEDGGAGVGCRKHSPAGPSVRVRVITKRAQFIPAGGSRLG